MITTASNTTDQIIEEFDEYILRNGGGYSLWYIGVTSHPQDRLFNDHKVDKNNDAWIYRDYGVEYAACRVEKHFLAKGCDGGTGGSGSSIKYAYAYKKKPHTRP